MTAMLAFLMLYVDIDMWQFISPISQYRMSVLKCEAQREVSSHF